ncbi:hypothetical protein GS943_02055 [Rhodococcus hoagii]|nr:hypothetical protein [Prescottella equi]
MRAAPHPASHSAATRIAFTTTPPSTTELSTAINQSCGTARAAASVSPSAESVTYDRGVLTASRSSR